MAGSPFSLARQPPPSPTGLLSNPVLMAGILDYVLINLPQQTQVPPPGAIGTLTMGATTYAAPGGFAHTPWQTFTTTDSSVFGSGDVSGTEVNAAGDVSLVFKQTGVYLVVAQVFIDCSLGVPASLRWGLAPMSVLYTSTTAFQMRTADKFSYYAADGDTFADSTLTGLLEISEAPDFVTMTTTKTGGSALISSSALSAMRMSAASLSFVY